MNSGKYPAYSLIGAISIFLSGELLCSQPAPPPITINPVVSTVTASHEVPLAVTYTGVDTLRWLVNGVAGGNAVVGSIAFPNVADRRTAIYHAPAAPTAVNSVTITVWAEEGASVASATVLVVPDCGSHCIKIGLAGHPISMITSYPLSPGKPTRFAAYLPNGGIAHASWTLTTTPTTGTPVIEHPPATADVVTYTWPEGPHDLSDVAAPTITLTAIPIDPVYPPTSVNLVAAPQVLIRCNKETQVPTSPCQIINFDRLHNVLNPAAYGDAGIVTAVNASKTIFSGSVISVRITAQPSASTCANFDWKIAVQAKESSGILVYDPSDVGSGICEDNRFILALPVHALWADVFGYHQLLDPTRPAPGKPAAFTDCAGQLAAPTILPCDEGTSTALSGFYGVGKLVNLFSPPGNGKGSISFSGKGEVSYDVVADPAVRAGPGWFNAPVVFERGAENANSNSLTFAGAYDFRWIRRPDFGSGPFARSPFILRKPQVQIRSGLELSPSQPAVGSAPSQTRDWNYIWGEQIRFPLVWNFHQQPSSLSLYPTFGWEEGWHLRSNLAQNDSIARAVTGIDGSFRWPFNATHNILGSTPIQLEGQYRIRGLLYKEPFTDFANLPPNGTALACPKNYSTATPSRNPGCMVLSSSSRKYYKGDITIPLDPYIQIQFTIYGGALPPDFWNVPHSITLGISFNNPGSSEH